MPKLLSTMEGDKVVLHIEIEPQDKEKNWCIAVSSKSEYHGGFYVPYISTILEYMYKVDTFCGTDSQIVKKEYMMPGQYLAVLGIGSKELIDTDPLHVINQTATGSGAIMIRFEITGLSVTDKDIDSAMKLLSCMAEIYNENNQKGEKVFDNMMLEPMFYTIIEFLNNIVDKRDISPYVDRTKVRIDLHGPILKEGKYFWPGIGQGKYLEYPD